MIFRLGQYQAYHSRLEQLHVPWFLIAPRRQRTRHSLQRLLSHRATPGERVSHWHTFATGSHFLTVPNPFVSTAGQAGSSPRLL